MLKETLIKLLEKLPANTHVWAFDQDGDLVDIRGLGRDTDNDAVIITHTEHSNDYESVIEEFPELRDDQVW